LGIKNIKKEEILEFEITPEDKFMIVASDGVWEYLSNEDVLISYKCRS
jgi:serine/threonine protein phosphatase PrpC